MINRFIRDNGCNPAATPTWAVVVGPLAPVEAFAPALALGHPEPAVMAQGKARPPPTLNCWNPTHLWQYWKWFRVKALPHYSKKNKEKTMRSLFDFCWTGKNTTWFADPRKSNMDDRKPTSAKPLKILLLLGKPRRHSARLPFCP